jgi:hypothetical protein
MTISRAVWYSLKSRDRNAELYSLLVLDSARSKPSAIPYGFIFHDIEAVARNAFAC